MKKAVLVAVNAKYIHSNLAVHSLHSYAAAAGYDTEVAEYTINQQPFEILQDLYEKNADVAGFSCYIWNINMIKDIIRDYHKVNPSCEIWLGGPEVSYRAEELLLELPEVRGIMIGEGEATFTALLACYARVSPEDVQTENKNVVPDFSEVAGIVVRTADGTIKRTAQALCPEFSDLPFPYGKAVAEEKEGLEDFENRIVYYESSRGCPFSCAYCLSSVDKKVRYRNLELVKKELLFFLNRRVPQVKFIDRTFNADRERTMQLLRFMKENDNGITNFHFEIAAELLTKEQLEFIAGLRPGMIQLEIGVQSVNPETLAAVRRKTEIHKLEKIVGELRRPGNVHLHLDLIAGLPKEDMASFINSFNRVYAMRPHELQLGFLKVLSGAPMEQMAKEQGIIYSTTPPYEVLSTPWLSFAELLRLKKVEEMVEIYYNSGQFVYSMMYLEHFFASPFSMYEELAGFYDRAQYAGRKLSRVKRYEILTEFIAERMGWETDSEELKTAEEILFYDFALREKVKGRPAFGRHAHLEKQELKEGYERFAIRREEEGMHGLERFSFDVEKTAALGSRTGNACLVMFRYEERTPVYGQAKVCKAEL